MSNTAISSTLAPAEVSAQVALANDIVQASIRKGPRRPAPPPGAIEIPSGGKDKILKRSPVTSGTIPLSGWGELDLSSHRRDILPQHTVNSNPFFDIVDFVYIYIGEEFQLPAPLAQYLANMVNFTAGGETFYFEKLSGQFSCIWASEEVTVQKGWLSTTTGIVVDDWTSFWRYANLPIFAVFALSIQAEIANFTNTDAPTLAHITPIVPGQIAEQTCNICGWYQQRVDVSDRLAGISELKLHGSNQLTLSNQRNANPSQFLFMDQFKRDASLGTRDAVFSRKGSLNTDFAILATRCDATSNSQSMRQGEPVYAFLVSTPESSLEIQVPMEELTSQ
ncbi:hypothetical protein V1514DRAFT_342994 [Lipomyces japonicus]|uniref:uncharacterized protein n=1 Tax=Lipomyces japonicus TaxID=56871 RepID=UPI0034CD3AB3